MVRAGIVWILVFFQIIGLFPLRFARFGIVIIYISLLVFLCRPLGGRLDFGVAATTSTTSCSFFVVVVGWYSSTRLIRSSFLLLFTTQFRRFLPLSFTRFGVVVIFISFVVFLGHPCRGCFGVVTRMIITCCVGCRRWLLGWMKAFRRWIPCALFGFAVVVIEFALVVVKGRPVVLFCCI